MKFIQFWNNLRTSIWWQNFIFLVNYPLKLSTLWNSFHNALKCCLHRQLTRFWNTAMHTYTYTHKHTQANCKWRELLFNILTCGCCNYRCWWYPDPNYRGGVHIVLCVRVFKIVYVHGTVAGMQVTLTQMCVWRRGGWESTGISRYISEELRGNIRQPLYHAHTHITSLREPVSINSLQVTTVHWDLPAHKKCCQHHTSALLHTCTMNEL